MNLAQRLRELPTELRLAGLAAAALFVSMVLPWYDKSFFADGDGRPVAVSTNLSAFSVFSFVEAAVLVVAAGVLYLIYARIEGRAFHLPGGDGVVISIAGGWAAALLVWRLFDKPDVDDPGATVGIQWGIFVALICAGLLVAAGARVRAAGRPEPPNPAEDIEWDPHPQRRERGAARPAARAERSTEPLRDRDADSRAERPTEVLGEPPPTWEGEPPPAPGVPPGRGGVAPKPPDALDRPTQGGQAPPAPDRLF